jgi:hypothetical protein
LTEHCKSFKLPHSGNKAALTQRLTAFSKDKEHWTRYVVTFVDISICSYPGDSILPGATNAHKGSRKPEADKKTKPKISTLRREGSFHDVDGVRVPNAPVTERSKDLRTAEEKAAIMPWVFSFWHNSIT